MDVRMSSLPTAKGGPVGGYEGGRYFIGKSSTYPVSPQVTLNLSVHPPVLDTAGAKPPPSNSSSKLCGASKRLGGDWWNSLRNMYNNIKSASSSTPLTWVNPDMVPQFHPATMQQSFYPAPNYSVMGSSGMSGQSTPLWYQAPPGSSLDYEDPMRALSSQYCGGVCPSGYPGGFMPSPKIGLVRSSQPLNPEAKEWVPNDFMNNQDDMSSIPKCSLSPPDKSVIKSLVIPSAVMPADFVEITDKEINEVRKDMENESSVKERESSLKPIVQKDRNTIVVNAKEMAAMMSKESQQGKRESMKQGEGFNNFDITFNNSILTNVDCHDKMDLHKVKHKSEGLDHTEPEISSISYASIARKSPEPLLEPNVKCNTENDRVPSPCEAVKQPLPKIFVKDKKYPKEKAVPLRESNPREQLPFKTASKAQKKCSRKFLKDLRDLSPAKSDCSFSSGSEGSCDSNSDFISRLCSSYSAASSSGLSPKEKVSVAMPTVFPKIGKSQRSASESSGGSCRNRSISESSTGGSCHNRSISESSTGSVESVDVEFDEEECDLKNDVLENVCVITEVCKSKYPNNILSHILGLDESDSDDSDEDSDDGDWDNADYDGIVLDESWETFGLSSPLTTKSFPLNSKSCDDDVDHFDVCDNYPGNDLVDVNKRWQEEVSKDVVGASPTRVRFGQVSVHPMVTWSFAYKNARRGPWEQYARDRARFNSRILALESIISPVLDSRHRDAVYRKIYGS